MFTQESSEMGASPTHVANKAKILDAASALFLEGGLSVLSVRAIAARAGVSTIGIYSHFQGKDGLLEALYVEGFELVSGAMEIDDASDPRGSVLAACHRYLDIADTYQAHYQLIFGDAGADYVPSETARAASTFAFERLISFTSILLPPDASYEVKQKQALEVWALMHGFVSLKRHSALRSMSKIDWRATMMDSLEKLLK